jgi:hypothetical protein
MKILEGQGPKIEDIGKTKIKNESAGDDFKKIMDQLISVQETKRSEPAQSLNAVPNIESIINVNRINPVNSIQSSGEKMRLLDSLSETLNLVDFYAVKLADENVPVKDLTPLVEELDARLESLKVMSNGDSLPETLKPVINDMTVTIGAEIAKYRRGDYF